MTKIIMSELSHINKDGKANMVDVGAKTAQLRIARAAGNIILNEETRKLIAENSMKKGDVLSIAQIAGIQGAKRASDLIPLCHPLQLTKVDVVATLTDKGVDIECEARCIGQTGVEMEALTGVNIALLTIYDMCKAVDKGMIMENVTLIKKTKTDL